MMTVTGLLAPVSLVALGLLIAPLPASLHPATRLGMLYGIGAIAVMSVIGALALIGLPISTAVVLPLTIGASLLARTIGRQTGFPPWAGRRSREQSGRWAGFRFTRLGVVGTLGLLMTVILAVLTLVRVGVTPITGWDGWGNYSLKGKIIYETGTIPRILFETVSAPNYPLGPPFQQAWAALVAGSWNETAIKLTMWGYFASIWLIAYGSLRDRYSVSVALVGALFVGALPLMVQHGLEPYTDLPLAYFVLAQAVAITQYVRHGRRSLLLAAAAFGAGSVLTRPDGVFFVIANVLLLTAVKVPNKDRLIYFGPAAVAWGVWAFAKARLGIQTNLDLGLPAVSVVVERFGPAVFELGQALFVSGNWVIVWGLFVVIFLMRFRSTFRAENVFFAWPVAGYLGVLLALFVMTELFQFLGRDTVLHRLILHVAPLAALWVAGILCEVFSELQVANSKGENSSVI